MSTEARRKLHSDIYEAGEAARRLRAAGKGARVVSTEKALWQGVVTKTTFGVITGWGHHEWTVLVRKDGRKTATGYHATFWEPVT